ncbi:MAG TPA: hypothetical protein VIP98_05635 [Microlunatus sp.]
MDLKKAATSPASAGLQAGLLALYPIGRAPRLIQIGFIAVPAAVAAITTYVGAPEDEEIGRRIAGCLGGASTLAAAQTAALLLDRATERMLHRAHAPAPRIIIATASGLTHAFLALLLRRQPPKAQSTAVCV